MYLSTPFSREAADRLDDMGVPAFKIGSGECNNYPLLDHIARMGKPMILSTGMNDIASVQRSVDAIREHGVPLALLHCTSMYPTPYEKVRLGADPGSAADVPGCSGRPVRPLHGHLDVPRRRGARRRRFSKSISLFRAAGPAPTPASRLSRTS